MASDADDFKPMEQVMQGDLVRSSVRGSQLVGWVCCITPESDEGHVYWQPCRDAPAVDSREPLHTLQCVDRALIPGDVVRRCDLHAGQSHDRGGRDRDGMGMVVGTEVALDLLMLQEEGRPVHSAVAASTVRHHMPIRLTSWVLHSTDGWLGRVQSWDEELVVSFSCAGGSRCRIRSANLMQGIAIFHSFYRDFFPGLLVSISLQELMPNGSLDCEWLTGSAVQVLQECAVDASQESMSLPNQRVEATIDEVRTGQVRVDWLAQVPLKSGWSAQRPPRSDGCREDELLLLLGEAECSSRWALGDRLSLEGALAEVCGVQTLVDVRWQDDALSVHLPSRELQLCNPDAFSFFPSELVCQRLLEDAPGAGPFSARSPSPMQLSGPPGRGAAEALGQALERQAQTGSTRRESSVGYVARADPASRMVSVRWLEPASCDSCQESGREAKVVAGPEEEWSAFDLQIDPEFGYRLGDAVIRCKDWEVVSAAPEGAQPEQPGFPRVGQVLALEASLVRVRWLDGTVSVHGPRELYRVGDEDEDASEAGGMEGDATALQTPDVLEESCHPIDRSPEGLEAGDELSTEDAGTARGQEEEASSGKSGLSSGAGTAEAGPEPSEEAAEQETGEPVGSAASEGKPTVDEEPQSELSIEDIVWEPLPQDHHFASSSSVPAGPSGRTFMRRVNNEWSILRRGLPRGVWVHVYPDRMELLRACLVGPEGTPYSDALFFFDVHLPPTYPTVPPQVKFWSFGENLNPNLYENGKVCLSLLGTWSGKESETWSAERSNLLQVLVSILGLVLNTEPYYNEPGFERERDTPQGGLRSQRYNESVALSSYHLMLRVLKAPPGDFGQLVKKHFAERRSAILERAKSLSTGEASPDASEGFRKSLAALLPRLEETLPLEASDE